MRKGKQIRVFHLIKSLGRGGAEVLLEEGLRFSDRARYHYSYGYFLPWKNAVAQGLEAQGAPVTCFGARNNVQILLGARRVAAELRRTQADLLHCHLAIAGVVGRIAGRLAGIPVVYTEHNMWERLHPVTRLLNRITWDLQELVIAVSNEVLASIRTHTTSAVPVRVIQNGVDVDRFDRLQLEASGVRNDLSIPVNAPVIGTVAVFTAKKRLLDWIQAASLVHEQHPNAHFVIVGDGPLRKAVAERVRQLRLDSVVHLVGLQEDVRPFLSVMDIYVMSSVFEGLPVALLEAMSMQCSAVCTAVGGIVEVIRTGENGLLVPAEQPDQLARAVSNLITEPSTLHRYATAGRRTVVENFSMRRVTAQLEAAYQGVLERFASVR